MAAHLQYITEQTLKLRFVPNGANDTGSIPAGYMIRSIAVRNFSGSQAVTGGIKIGTTSGGTEVLAAYACAAAAYLTPLDSEILKRYFSESAATTLYLQAVTSWNSATITVVIFLDKVIV